MKGPGLIDYFSLKINENKKIEINLKNCLDPLYFLPLLYRSSNNIYLMKTLVIPVYLSHLKNK